MAVGDGLDEGRVGVPAAEFIVRTVVLARRWDFAETTDSVLGDPLERRVRMCTTARTKGDSGILDVDHTPDATPGRGALPVQLPAGLSKPVRVTLLVDGDHVSWEAGKRSGGDRGDNATVRAMLHQIAGMAVMIGEVHRVRIACSPLTAQLHLDLIFASGHDAWRWKGGQDGADELLIEELETLENARRKQLRRGAAAAADVVALVGADHIYADKIRSLRLLGVPAVIIQPGQQISHHLYREATQVVPLRAHLAREAA
ncbi:hypothetical protein [Nonomuraea sp. NPDC049400]|uniref:hypothetical protein n=1 Tax=Nonomuraea sp. NPDC049400 TaxID=3364352 RepID=UPI0037A8EE57